MERRVERAALHDQVTAANTLGDAGCLLDEELAIHHRHPPETSAVDDLRFLVAVAKKPHVPAEGNAFLLSRHAVEHGRRRAGEEALGDAVGHRLGEAFSGKSKQQHEAARPAVGGFVGREEVLHPDFGVAADHARAIAAGGPQGGVEPVAIMGRDEEPAEPESERLGKGVDDLCGFDEHREDSLPS